MDLYLHTGGRAKGEWFPDTISGVSRCSRTEIHDDIEYITANLPFNAVAASQQAAAAAAAAAAHNDDDMDDEEDAPQVSSSRAASRRGDNKRKMTKNERVEVDLEREAAATKRARLQHKIQQERHRLDSTKENGYMLRQQLDTLRAETQQYEDAIAQTKREMEMIQRETQILEERLQQSRSEYHWGLDQAERIRVEEEKIETMLREKLSHVNTQVNDVSDRVHQLRQLEEEFKLKDVRIKQLETECSKYETQIQLLDQLITKQISGGTPNSASAAAAAASTASASASSSTSLPVALAQPTPAVIAPSPTPPSVSNVPVPDPNMNLPLPDGVKWSAVHGYHIWDGTEERYDPSRAAAEQNQDVKMETTEQQTLPPTPAATTAVAVTTPTAAVASVEPTPVVAPAAATTVAPPTVIAPLLPIPSGPNPSLSDLLTSIHSSTTTIAQLTMTLKLHEEQLESSNRQLIDRDRAMKYMQEQIERFSNLNHELNYKLKQSENLTLEERAKLEQSYKQILFSQKQKEEQSIIISSYEEKLKVFEQLLNVADVRATSAEENVSDMLSELKSNRMSMQILQMSYNKLVKEYERSVREKYAAMEEAHQIAESLQNSAGVSKSLLHNSQDGDSSVAASPRGVEPRTPLRFGRTNSTDGDVMGYGGINGLASPMISSGDHSGDLVQKFDYGSAAAAASSSSSSSLGASAVPPHINENDAPALAAHYHKFNMLLTQQNRDLTVRLNQMSYQNTQLQMALVKLAHRPTKSATSPHTPSAHTHSTTIAVAPAVVAAVAAAASSSPHTLPNNGIKSEHAATTNGHHHSAMDIDTLPQAASSSASSTSPSMNRANSGTGGYNHRSSTSSSPLQTPRSPRPPLHPNLNLNNANKQQNQQPLGIQDEIHI